ncbi:MAG: hypothetical protein N2316_07605, partial [Spirochaetes bacterium]|nr:hypothetical protein [Spirochaetota bacterium]
MKNAIIIIFFIFFCFTHASGGNAVFFPPASVGRGGSVQAIAEPGSFFYNPACAPVVASWSLYGWYGFSADTSIAVLEMVFPIAPLYYGTTVAYGWQEDEHEHVAHKWSAGAIGCGGDIVRSVNWGVSLQFFQKDETSSSFITAIQMCIRDSSMGVGFGIYSISLGFSHGEVVFAEHEDTAWFDPRMSSIGAGLLLYKRSHVSLRIASEFDAMWSYQSYNAKGGGEIIFFDKLFTRFGV